MYVHLCRSVVLLGSEEHVGPQALELGQQRYWELIWVFYKNSMPPFDLGIEN